MADDFRTLRNNNFLYWGLFVYVLCLLGFSDTKTGFDQVRIPSFAILLIILVQVVFPQFRFSTKANTMAIVIVIGTAIVSRGLMIH